MTFWGVEVKPGKPYTLRYADVGGKLILSQATLGAGSSSKKSTLQCIVGDSSPVYLCTLLPEKSECCPLNHEFEEEFDVNFSVIGPTSIHLSGYIQGDHHDCDGEDCVSDSSGEDIAETETEDSDYDSEGGEDYDFIVDDDDPTLYRRSTVPKSGVVIEEIVDDEKNADENSGAKKPKKKNKSTASDDGKVSQQQIVLKGSTGTSFMESEDEDGFPVSSSHDSKPDTENHEAVERIGEEGKKKKQKKKKKKNDKKDDSEDAKNLKRKADTCDEELKSDAADIVNGAVSEDKKKMKKKKAKKENGADMNTEEKNVSTADKGVKQSKTKPAKARTFANGLVIEELQMGRPDGKRASRGSKVSVCYIGRLQKNGKQFDSNIGRAPFKFRLGVGQVIKGWDVGVEGMRVGDKRRLTIPPSMGYGASGAPPQIPPNSWLVFDVELINVA